MAVSNTTVKQVYTGNDSNTTFAIPFAYISGQLSDIDVYLVDSTTGEKTLQAITTDYTRTPTGDDPTNIEFVTAPTSSQKVLVERSVPNTQAATATSVAALDKLTLLVQQLQDKLNDAPQINILDVGVITNSLPKFEASKVLATDSAGTAWEWASLSSLVGATGADGATGARGPVGNSILSGASTPAVGIGSEGDLYLDTTLGILYGPKTTTATPWSQTLSLKGPTGATGPAVTVTTYGTRLSPRVINPAISITTGAGHMDPQVYDQVVYVEGQNAGENVIVPDPQIEVGQSLGQRMVICNVNPAKYISFQHGAGLRLNGPWVGDSEGKSLSLFWDGQCWNESARWSN